MTSKTRSSAKQSSSSMPAPPTKISSILEMVRRREGATLLELTEVTGWQPHSVRAVLTDLRRKGHTIERTKRGEESCYRIAEQG